MFTGIVRGICRVVDCTDSNGLIKLSVDVSGVMRTPILGSSVAVNGCCLTVTSAEANGLVGFDVIAETARITNLGRLKNADPVNIEPSFRVGDEVGGHIVSGHIACCGKIHDLAKDCMTATMVLQVPKEWMKYLMPKGFVALNGASLTIAEVDRIEHAIAVNLIPETLKRTSFGVAKIGDLVNLEVDSQTQAVVETTLQVLAAQRRGELS